MRRIRCGAESTHIIDQVDLHVVTLVRWGGGMLYAVDVCGGWRACTSLLVATVLYSTRCLLCDVFARYGIRVAPVASALCRESLQSKLVYRIYIFVFENLNSLRVAQSWSAGGRGTTLGTIMSAKEPATYTT